MNPATDHFAFSSLNHFNRTGKEKMPSYPSLSNGSWKGAVSWHTRQSQTHHVPTWRERDKYIKEHHQELSTMVAWREGGQWLSAVAKTVPPPLLSPNPIHGLTAPIGSPAASNDHDRFSSSSPHWLLPMAYYQGRANQTRNR